jgi:acylphosphatase
VVTEVTAVRLTAWVEGRVQGVGFRWWVRSRALELGLVGFAENLADGRVKVVAEGASGRCQDLLALLTDGGGDGAGGGRSGGDGSKTGGGDGPGSRGLVWPGRFGRPGRVTRVAHRWAEALGDMSGFTER